MRRQRAGQAGGRRRAGARGPVGLAPALAGGLALFAAACGGAGTRPPERPAAEDEEPAAHAVALRFEDAGTDAQDMPHTGVRLVHIAPDGARTVVALSEETGACYHTEAVEALISARCWWAGEGARFIVRREGDAVVAHRAEVHEETGARDLVEAGRVEIPEDAPLQILAPGNPAPIP
ncbi:MAG TPA: hypothetical protein RMH99_14470 [Sandaracinaceae bacterium LLY-WYZ-13_1]|nr:hypothetical protein [Sandaracinaceae bacterium LLY-WYZ-13_1]